MKRFARGEVGAFTVLYERYGDEVFGFCLRMLGDADAAADALQDTFVRVIDRRSDFRRMGRFRSWLFLIARNVCIDQFRARDRWIPLAELPQGVMGDAAHAHVTHRIECREAVARCLSILAPAQREVLLLHRYHGFAYREIAELLGTSEVAVKQAAYRAVRTLRRWAAEQERVHETRPPVLKNDPRL
ncbi:MAG: RNA polymerase sigma factor [Gemmatimonadetes bacterium]|nr:RNA polymerase sigma factor [Gemmatimonadota bacterium]